MKVLLLTDDEHDVATFANLGVERTGGFSLQEWEQAPLVFLGLDRVLDVAFCTRRSTGVLLLGKNLDDATIWDTAVSVGAERVLFLPDALPYVQHRLANPTEMECHPA